MAPIATSEAPPIPASSTGVKPTPLEAISHGLTLPGIPSFDVPEDKRQWIKEHMAGVFRVFARLGYAEGMSGHISVLDPIQTDAMWMNPLGVHFGMLKASDMVLVNYYNGEIVGGKKCRPVNAAGVLIHAAIHKARSDVQAICHAHSIHGVSYSTFAKPLEMLNQDVCNIFGVQGVYSQYGGIVFGEEEGAKMAQALGPEGKGLILMNHGLLTVGKTCDEAGYLFRLMEKSCKIQLEVDAAAANGLKKHIISDEEAAYNYKMASESNILYREFQPELEYEEFLSGPGFKA
ncbi:putative aldolase [Usnea florida]